MSPDVVVGMLARLGGHVARIYVLGCQPANLEEGMMLSAPVASAVDGAVEMCVQLVAEILEPAGKGTPS
jgi:hydrogenase maturation protease